MGCLVSTLTSTVFGLEFGWGGGGGGGGDAGDCGDGARSSPETRGLIGKAPARIVGIKTEESSLLVTKYNKFNRFNYRVAI